MKAIIAIVVQFAIIVALGIMLHDEVQKNRDLTRQLQASNKACTQMINNGREVIQAALKAPEVSKKMQHIASKRPELLERKINKGFQDLADTITEMSK